MKAAPQDPAVDFKSRKELEELLDEPRTVSFNQPLEGVAASFEKNYGISVFIDRRIDPTRTIDFSVRDVPIRNILQAIAEQIDAGASFLEWGVYIGPKVTQRRLGTTVALHVEEIADLPSQRKTRLQKKNPLKWERGAHPNEIIEKLCSAYDIDITNTDELPFDIWNQKQLPEMSFAESLGILLAGFDATFEWAEKGKTVRIVNIPQDVTLKKTYAVKSNVTLNEAEMASEYPGSEVKRSGAQLTVTGPWELHREVQASLANKPRVKTTTTLEKVYTLKVAAGTDAILAKIAEQLGYQLDIDASVKEQASKQIMLEVTSVKESALLAEIAKQSGLKIELREKTIFVTSGN